jgi:hypothetical protein
LDDDEYKEYLDYSYDRTFNDYETSTLPFEIPIFVNDYVNSRITSSKLQISEPGRNYQCRFLENGSIPVDNNRAENATRPFVAG